MDERGNYVDVDGEVLRGFFDYKGLLVMQNPNAFDVFEAFLATLRPARILEIGTARGGLTLFLRDTLDGLKLQDSPIRSFDILRVPEHEALDASPGIELIHQNPFTHSYQGIKRPELLIPFVRAKGTTLILCDGGSKMNEFRLLAPHLKVGDVIMAHDYAPDESYFREHIVNRHWNWLEIQDSDVAQACEQSNLVPFMQDQFLPVVWLCRKRTA